MKVLTGKVISLKTPQTATVLVEEQWRHPIYGKFVKRSKKVACHYTELALVDGDVVEIASCRPMSKTKRYQVVKKIEG
jgi:small subunit ribosomal protein S17